MNIWEIKYFKQWNSQFINILIEAYVNLLIIRSTFNIYISRVIVYVYKEHFDIGVWLRCNYCYFTVIYKIIYYFVLSLFLITFN